MGNNLKDLNIILLGDVASGKGTQSEYLQKKYNWYDFDVGYELSRLRKKDKKVDVQLKKTSDLGNLAPTSIIKQMYQQRISKLPKSRGIIFDGTPKMLGEAKLLVKLIKQNKRKLPLVLYIQIPLKESIQRIKGRTGYKGAKHRRADDTTSALTNRLRYYRKNIKEVLTYLDSVYILAHIDGMGTKTEVRKRIEKAIKFYSNNYEQIHKKT